MCLRFVFLLAAQIPAWLRLSRRPPTWKDAEILLLRHQLAILQRQTAARPKLRWTDRALFAALLTLIPRSCHGALHLFITPGTILRWHRDIVRRRWAAKSKPKRPGWPPTHRRTVRLVLRMAADNEHWGYRRIAGELAGLGIAVAPSTVCRRHARPGATAAPFFRDPQVVCDLVECVAAGEPPGGLQSQPLPPLRSGRVPAPLRVPHAPVIGPRPSGVAT